MRVMYTFPRYQKRGSFRRIKVYLPDVSPVCIVPMSEFRVSAAVLGFFYNDIKTSVIREEADV